MLKILINDPDLLFRRGMKYFLSDFFFKRFNRQVEFITDYTSDNIADADVIILSLCNGERYICLPELRARKKGIIVGLVDEEDDSRGSPYCFADIVYIQRREPLSEITRKLTAAWQKWIENQEFQGYKSCFGCKHVSLSLTQLEIITGLNKGYSFQEVATNMNITYKTVTTHKYLIMRKFCLRNDYDLFRFLGRLNQKSAI
ncbi:helix-turn-helix transcriptional regulator [Enterobacter chuandaensis]|uniref:Helix-turn-helix transcriptional regulator n=1 Tax=Enterobacter chuandaensis TaxID=2497875 RepID=A0AA96M7Q5_9ENTR|nr:LuxR C-terminal-related transcriptional regulator [Enterobacter chuandaensis]MCW4781578.1 LuxR C-terminal-related transcriptional regulator [Enterobacter chuandaensis]MDA4759430.1 LuxR C-terminal-related transcriptional regulator [Enterobacter chuandaensis]WNS39359.1 LuxR C-terminal-related transcriptional regulator [Enterobacter chuandaensis]